MTLAELQALVQKKEQARAAVKKRMADALAASEAEGITAEAKARHLAEFDAAEAELPAAEKELARATALRDAEQRADAHDRREAEPARARIAQPVTQPGAIGRVALPATPRRHGPLRAHRGENAVQRAELAGMWAAATIYGDATARRWCSENGVEFGSAPLATLNTTDNPGAGVFVPNEVEYSILELAEEYGVFRQYAEVVGMNSGTKDSPRWTRGMTAYWSSEGQKPTQSDPAWDMIKLVAKDLKALTKLSKNLDEDSVVDLGDKIVMCMAEAFFLAEDNAGFNGDATSTYGGITGLVTKINDAAAAYHTAASGNVTPATLDVDDFNAVVAKFPNWKNLRPAWFMHKSVWANACQRLQLNAGGTLPQDIANGGMPMFLGYPVVWVNVLPSAPTAGVTGILFGDLRYSSKLGSRRGRTIESGYENDDFTKGLISVVGTQRVDIVNHTVTDPRNSSNPGPVMGLKLAAS